MEPRDIERGDARLRKAAILALLLTLGVGAGAIVGLQHWLDSLRMRPAPEARQALATALVWSTGAICVVILAAAVHAWRLGARVRDASRSPPPGMRVIRDTVVLHGSAARCRGQLLQGLAVALVLGGAGLLVAALRLYSAP